MTKLLEGARRLAEDPLAFTAMFWPRMLLYTEQRDILLSVRDNVKTIVYGANTMGKDRIAALAALWFFCTRTPCKVVTTSSNNNHLKHVLWGEIEGLVRSAERPLNVDLDVIQARKPLPGGKPGEHQANTYMIGLVTNKVESFQGHHLDGSDVPRVLYLLDEATGIESKFFDAAETQFHRLLAISNPMTTGNGKHWFYREVRGGDSPRPDGQPGLHRKVIHLSGHNSPNVKAAKKFIERGGVGRPPTMIRGVLSWEEYLIRQQWPARRKRIRLDGLFVEDEGAMLFPQTALDLAKKVHAKVTAAAGLRITIQVRGQPKEVLVVRRGPKAMGIDCGEGGDLTVWSVVDRFGLFKVVAKRTPNTAQIAGMTVRLMKEHKIDPRFVVFDAGGGGKQHADLLRDRGYDGILDVAFGAAPDREFVREYRNMRAQLYGLLAQRLEETRVALQLIDKDPLDWQRSWCHWGIPEEENLLLEDLSVLPKNRDSEGRLLLPPKDSAKAKERHSGEDVETIRGMLGRSPDHGDSFALGHYGFWRLEEYQRLEGLDRELVK